jgi:hypothetical protein
MGRLASWKLTTTSPRQTPASLSWLPTPSPCEPPGRCRGSAFSLRLQDSCACGVRIDRTRARRTSEQAGRSSHKPVLWRTSKVTAARTSRPRQPPRWTLGRLPGSSVPVASAQTDRPPPRAASPNRISLPHTPLQRAQATPRSPTAPAERAQPDAANGACRPMPTRSARRTHPRIRGRLSCEPYGSRIGRAMQGAGGEG